MADTPDQTFQKIVNTLNKTAEDAVTGGRGDSTLSNNKSYQATLARQEQNGVKRTPWIMTTTEWQKQNKAIIWNANPSDIRWSMPQRSVHSKNLVGTVLHVWPDPKRHTFFDELKLSMTFQSGSILPVDLNLKSTSHVNNIGQTNNGSSNYVPSGGIGNFYDFMQLVDAPKLTSDTPARANLVYIQYTSNLFPQLTLMGMFEPDGISFTDDSQNPNQVTSWSANFLVYDTFPRLSDNSSGQQTNIQMLAKWAQAKGLKPI